MSSLDFYYAVSPLRVYLDYQAFREEVLRKMCQSLGVPLSVISPTETLRIEYLPTAKGGP